MDEFTSTENRKAVTITGLSSGSSRHFGRNLPGVGGPHAPNKRRSCLLSHAVTPCHPKVIIICGAPILMSLAITFGITVIADIMLTPMIISVGPILVGLGSIMRCI